jgi:hypothetical protein
VHNLLPHSLMQQHQAKQNLPAAECDHQYNLHIVRGQKQFK